MEMGKKGAGMQELKGYLIDFDLKHSILMQNSKATISGETVEKPYS